MNSGQKPQGYTIVEVMIFLVITGSLMASALAVFRGQQGKVQFTQGVRETEAQIKTVINEVNSGYYPNKSGVICQNSGGSPQLSLDESAGETQGENEDCIFLGKVIQFSMNGNYDVYSVVGLRQTGSPPAVQEATSLADTRPTPIASDDPAMPDVTERFTMPYGLTVTAILQQNEGGQPPTKLGAIGYMMSLAAYGEGGADLLSGSQSTNVIPLKDSSLTDSKLDTIGKIEGKLGQSSVNNGKIVICLKSGSDDRRAAIVLGSADSQLSTQTIIDDNATLDSYGCPS